MRLRHELLALLVTVLLGAVLGYYGTEQANAQQASGLCIAGTLCLPNGTHSQGQLLLDDGSASAPSLSFFSDTDTGFYRSTSGQMRFTSNGTAVSGMTAGVALFPATVNNIDLGASTVEFNELYLGEGAASGVLLGNDQDHRIWNNTTGNLLTFTSTTGTYFDQTSTTGAVPTISIDQGDADETFINFVGTSASDTTASISTEPAGDNSGLAGATPVAAPDDATWDVAGMVRVDINGTQYWMPYYTLD